MYLGLLATYGTDDDCAPYSGFSGQRSINLISLAGDLMKGKITLKRFARGYIDDLIRIFELSIKKTCDKDYTEGQISAWLSGADKYKWIPMFESHYSLVAFLGEKPVGFGDISDDGYLNMLYAHPRYQRRGIATLICDRLEKHAQGDIIVDASCTAKDFFLKRGYKVMMKQTVYRKGVALDNFRMSKDTPTRKSVSGMVI